MMYSPASASSMKPRVMRAMVARLVSASTSDGSTRCATASRKLSQSPASAASTVSSPVTGGTMSWNTTSCRPGPGAQPSLA